MIRKITFSFVMCAGFIGTGLFFHGRLMSSNVESKQSFSRFENSFLVQTLEPMDLEESLLGYGTAQAYQRVNLSSEVRGVVIEKRAGLRAGATVKKAEMLLRIDASDYEEEIRRAEGQLAQAEAEVLRIGIEKENLEEKIVVSKSDRELSAKELQRYEKLRAQGVAAQTELDSQRLQVQNYDRALLELKRQLAVQEPQRQAAEGLVKTRNSELATARLNVERTRIVAPFDGVVAELRVEPGELVNTNQFLMRLVDLSRIEIPAELPASRIDDVELGAKALIFLESETEPLAEARVDRISAEIDLDNRTFEVYLVIDNQNMRYPRLRPGVFIRAEIQGPVYRGVLAVPRSLLVEDRLFVVEDGVARERRPELLGYVGDMAILGAGVEAGDKVVASNLELVFDGAEVNSGGKGGKGGKSGWPKDQSSAGSDSPAPASPTTSKPEMGG